jgi:hypothetical protein
MYGIHGEGTDGIPYFLWIIDRDDENRLEACFCPGLGISGLGLGGNDSSWDCPL